MKPNDTKEPTLYVKPSCPWCELARKLLRERGVDFEEVSVAGDPDALGRMERVSGQTLTPVLEWNGDVLADFGPEELEPFLDERLGKGSR